MTPAEDLADWIHRVFDLAEDTDDGNATIAELLSQQQQPAR